MISFYSSFLLRGHIVAQFRFRHSSFWSYRRTQQSKFQNNSFSFYQSRHYTISKPEIEHLVSLGTPNVSNLLSRSLQLSPKEKYILLYDDTSELSKIITECYQRALKSNEGITLNFFEKQPADIIEAIHQLNPGDIVVMVQSDCFRLDEYRFRLKLFERHLKNIEHVHLGFIPTQQYLHYVNALSFDPQRDGSVGLRLKQHIDKTKKIVVECYGGTQLVYDTEMEPTLLNIGDYSGMKNVGGTFPIGEVFSEAKNFTAVNGELMVWGYPNVQRFLEIADSSFKITIEKGIITKIDNKAPPSFQELWKLLTEADETMVREFGLGLNKAMGRDKPVVDVTAFERQQGLHISVGKKHTVYKKNGISRRAKSKFHIDLFIDVQRITMDDVVVFENGNYCI